MANTVRLRFRSYLPGVGFDSSGRAVQGKQEVRGRVIVSSYTRGGENLTPRDVGLTSVDYLSLEVVDPVKSPGANPLRFAAWNETNNQFYIFETDNAGNDVVEAADTTAVTLAFSAFGDAAHDVELL